jgi:stage III sporulation protein AF
MIGAIRTWLTSVVVVSLLLSVAQTLIPEGSIRKIAAFTGGLVLLVTLLRPLLGMDLSRLDLDRSDYAAAIQARQEELTAAGEKELSSLIAERTEAYIWDKGDELGLSVTAKVTTETEEDGVPVPVSAELWGQRSEQLAAYMEEELGIPGERQVWHET